MIKIAVCDDDEKELNKTITMCNEYRMLHPDYDLSIKAYSYSRELMLDFEQQEQADIVLLDIYMPEITGIELARVLRVGNLKFQIIFLTTSLGHAVEAFSLHAAHYLVKPFTAAQLEDALSKAVDAVEKIRNSQIILKTPEGIQRINFTDFLYSETDRHEQRIYLTSGECIRVRITCSELFSILSSDKRFYRCGSTYIMNLAKIKVISSHGITYDNGTQYEGCLRLPQGTHKFIKINTRYDENHLAVGITNSCSDDIAFMNGIPVSSKRGGGIGTRSITYTIQRFQGTLFFGAEEGVFSTRFILYI